jgi:hypothetical protein
MDPSILETKAKAEDTLLKGNLMESDQGETEDEEVKRNCVMGLSGLRDSDFADTDDDDDVDDDENQHQAEPSDDENAVQEEKELQALVQFVPSGQMISKPQGVLLYRPTPIAAMPPSHRDESDDNKRHTKSNSEAR